MSSVIEIYENVDADGWAKDKTRSSLSSRATLREKLARDLAEFEAKRGPVATMPIRINGPVPGDVSAKPPAKKDRPFTPTKLQLDIISAIQKGNTTVFEICGHLGIPSYRVHNALDGLIQNNLVQRVSRGQYDVVKPQPSDSAGEN